MGVERLIAGTPDAGTVIVAGAARAATRNDNIVLYLEHRIKGQLFLVPSLCVHSHSTGSLTWVTTNQRVLHARGRSPRDTPSWPERDTRACRDFPAHEDNGPWLMDRHAHIRTQRRVDAVIVSAADSAERLWRIFISLTNTATC